MYRILCDGKTLYAAGSSIYTVTDPTLTLELNSAGSLSFSLTHDNPYYDLPQMLKSEVYVLDDAEEIFRGRIINIQTDWFNNKIVECEGELAFLNDTIQRPKEYHAASITELFTAYVNYHNSWIYANRRFTVGQITVTTTDQSIFRYTNWNSTMQEIQEDLIDNYGGYIRVRNEGGVRYLDYIKSYGRVAPQKIEFSKNLLDLETEWDGLDICTRLIPLGARLETSSIEGLEEYLTIKSVNNNLDYIDAQQSMKDKFGVITKVVRWEDVTTASILKTKAQAWMNNQNFNNVCITSKAVDLHLSDKDVAAFRIGDMVNVVSKPHNVDVEMLLSKIELKLDKPSESTFTIGENSPKGITGMLGGA